MNTNLSLILFAASFSAGLAMPAALAQPLSDQTLQNIVIKGSGIENAAKSMGMHDKENQPLTENEIQAHKLLDEAKAKLLGCNTLIADYESNQSPTRSFHRQDEIIMERPNKYAVVAVHGAVAEERTQLAVCDGQKVTKMDINNYVGYARPVRAENFFLGQNFLVQFFFDTKPISFDPTDETWGKPVSVYDMNDAAYDKDTKYTWLGRRDFDGETYQVVEIKYNTFRQDIRQQVFVGDDRLVYQVDTYFDGSLHSQKFRNYRLDEPIPPDTYKVVKWDDKTPIVETDPVRLGQGAPDFTLPGYNGEELNMKTLLKGKKGMLVCTLDAGIAIMVNNADVFIKQMRILQELHDRFDKQGLVIVCIYGGSKITPDLVSEMKLNWMPDCSRFNYPIAIDVDLERGIQGSAFQNFQLKGRNNILMDKDAKVVYAAKDFFNDRVNQLALYQAMAQLGFGISPADLESSAAKSFP